MIVPGSLFDEEASHRWVQDRPDAIKAIGRKWPLGSVLWCASSNAECIVIGWLDRPEPALVLIKTEDVPGLAGEVIPNHLKICMRLADLRRVASQVGHG